MKEADQHNRISLITFHSFKSLSAITTQIAEFAFFIFIIKCQYFWIVQVKVLNPTNSIFTKYSTRQ